jgi:hypothetical protein
MERERYATWMKVFQRHRDRDTSKPVTSEDWDSLFVMLAQLWKEDRSTLTPDELQAYSAATGWSI